MQKFSRQFLVQARLPVKEGADIQIQKCLILNVKPAHHSGFVLQIFDPRLLVFCLQQILLNLIFRLQIFFVFSVKMNNIFPRDHSAAPLLEIRS